MKLNLGCNDRHMDGFVSVDIAPPADVITDLREPWPWPDSSVDEVMALDVIEHLPDRIHTMNELWRVMRPGAVATIEVPNAAKGAGFYQDPTHTAAFCMNSFQYFEYGSFAHKRLAQHYGINAAFEVKLWESDYQDAYEKVWKIHAILRAVK